MSLLTLLPRSIIASKYMLVNINNNYKVNNLKIKILEGENPRSETPSNTATNSNSNAGNTTPTSQTATIPTNNSAGPDEEEVEPPAVVVYLVEPFSLGGAEDPHRRRLAILALLRAYSTAVNSMPENIRSNINVQVKFHIRYYSILNLHYVLTT